MLWKEKIRQMNDDELADFIVGVGCYGGFMDQACKVCPYHVATYECGSKDYATDCRISVKSLLDKEVGDAEVKT